MRFDVGEWFYTKSGQQCGPISSDELRSLAASEQLDRTDQVWKEGMASWVAASAIKGLFPHPMAVSAPPPLPRTSPKPPPVAVHSTDLPPQPISVAPPIPRADPPLPKPLGQTSNPFAAKPAVAMTVKPHEDFDQEAVQKIKDAMIPRLLLGMACGTIVALLAAFITFRSVLLTIPLMAMLGIWMILNSFRITTALKGGSIFGAFSPIRRVMTLVRFISFGPLLLVAVGFTIGSDPEGTIRIVMLLYTVVALPVIGYTLQQVRSILAGPSKPA